MRFSAHSRSIRILTTIVFLAVGILSPAAWSQVSSVVTLLASPNPAAHGVPVTLTAGVLQKVTPEATGTMIFYDTDGSQLGTADLDSSTGAATLIVSTLATGKHSLTASYSGDSNYLPGTSQPLTETILAAQTPTVTSVSSSLNPSTVGAGVAFTATIEAASSTRNPTGQVTFYDDVTVLGTAPVVTEGTGSEFFHRAHLPAITSLTLGSHPITAVYSGDSSYAGSTSAVLNQVVQPIPVSPTTTALSSNPNPSISGQSITFTAIVSSAVSSSSAIATGTVQFTDNGVVLAVVDLDSTGQAAFGTSLTVGTHTIVASYSGDSNFAESSSAPLNQQVLPPPLVPTTVALTSSDPQPTSGELITLTATVTPTSGGNGIPTGTVTLQDGSTTLDVITLDQNGAATLSTASLSVGAHTILASYSGDSVFAASSATLSLVVNPPSNVPTQTVVGPSVNPSMYGSSVSFTALVTGDGGTPTGTIIFTLSSAASSVTTAPVSLDSSGQAVFTTAALPTGLVSVVAVYSGDTMFAGSTSATLNETINQAPTMTAVVSSANPATVGTSINFTATVMSGTSGTPTGSVTFQDGTSNIGSANLDGNGKAQVTLSTLSPGPHNIVASYLGDINFLPSDNSSSPLVETINQATTTTALTSSLNPAAVGAPVTFSISVTSTGGTPTGSVTLQDGASTLGSAVLNGSAQAQLTISQLNAGSHSIVASYSGDANFQVSTSTSLVETVNQASTVTTLVSSINPASAGAQLIFTASISSSAGTLTPTGSVNFLDGGASIGSAVLSGNGQAQVAVSTLAVGSHTVVASYSGDTNFQTSVSAPLVEVINPATIATATTLASSANPAILNSPITFTATVTSSSDRPTGSVIFQDGGSPIGSATVHLSGHARLTIDSLSVGSHSITAVYSGNGNFQPSLSAPLIETVELPAPPPPAATANLAIAGIESDKNVEPGELLVYVVTVINAGPGAANGVNLSDILPDGTTFVSARATLGSCTSPAIGVNSRIGTLQCNVGSLAKSARWSVFLTVRVTAKPGSTLSNNVSVTSSTSNPNRRNTSATVVTRVLARRSD